MNAKEFDVAMFEKNNPDVMKIIAEWENISIDRNLGYLLIPLGRVNLKNVPESKWDEKLKANAEWYFFDKLQDKLTNYLFSKGYKQITKQSCQIPVLFSDDVWYSCYTVKAFIYKEKILQLKEIK